ncbi:hypothetical protein [Chryseobacterium sp.]|uniref:hypothetical protein n=1 Tax=Chryseobacterium sp. TaxID=1871047 RepID=UPI0011C84607|nr:hypothetical protein [Chryseobacterium sp.]TXF77749.1 hypothetical protein FUA25_07445 [Chryseobacterium sp.]
MKKLFIIGLAALCAVTSAQTKKNKKTVPEVSAAQRNATQGASSATLSLESIIKKNIEALGGAEKLREAKSAMASGVIYTQQANVPIKTWMVHNEGLRLDMQIQGRTNTTVVTPYGAWTLFPAQRQKRAVDSDLATAREGAEELDMTGDLLDYRNKGNTVELLGSEDVEGNEAYKLKVTRKSGTTVLLFLDATSFLLLKRVIDKTIDGKVTTVTERYSNYAKTPDGYVYATVCDHSPSGYSIKLIKYEVNAPVDPKIFEKP